MWEGIFKDPDPVFEPRIPLESIQCSGLHLCLSLSLYPDYITTSLITWEMENTWESCVWMQNHSEFISDYRVYYSPATVCRPTQLASIHRRPFTLMHFCICASHDRQTRIQSKWSQCDFVRMCVRNVLSISEHRKMPQCSWYVRAPPMNSAHTVSPAASFREPSTLAHNVRRTS